MISLTSYKTKENVHLKVLLAILINILSFKVCHAKHIAINKSIYKLLDFFQEVQCYKLNIIYLTMIDNSYQQSYIDWGDNYYNII